ncbi:SiaB family protein kinase [Marinoscillum sp. 108]|jgi:hypothetical protein|uniref:SiaB family protein kinase n=1 Tax=Marinoscillum sp. 108 TaxID=2653151 RepID=UPI0012EF1828|nr:SiaB family protein kinase [Marinoscillum sp. 108]VXD19355.1 conserved hypothetical protein [Marinoscillum sp. 108]
MENSTGESENTLSRQLRYLQSVITLKDMMDEENLNIVYLGRVTQSTIDGIADMTKEGISEKGENSLVTKRVYHVMIESLQNICKHADSKASYTSDSLEEGLAKEGVFLIGDNETEYFVTTGNRISMPNAIRLRDVLDKINELDRDEIKALYKTAMMNSELSEKGGAGLGFIDMAKKTGTKYEYYFEPLDNESCFFILTIRISKK